jgi:DNA-binding NtrC family response regulator
LRSDFYGRVLYFRRAEDAFRPKAACGSFDEDLASGNPQVGSEGTAIKGETKMNVELQACNIQDHLPRIPAIEGSARFADGLVMPERLRQLAAAIAEDGRIGAVLWGETGTGKEMLARLIHKRRTEREGEIPFIAVNCANLNTDTMLSTFFGHRKGAFTGAEQTTTGLVGEADGGILFLDEIHALSPACQQRLLRVLADGSYERLGDTKTMRSQFQLIAATTKDLDVEVEEGRFLLDLRMRVTGIDLEMPALRERAEDLADLIRLFFAKEGVAVSEVELGRLTERAAAMPWRGNVRQLYKALQALCVMARFNKESIRAEGLVCGKIGQHVARAPMSTLAEQDAIAPRSAVAWKMAPAAGGPVEQHTAAEATLTVLPPAPRSPVVILLEKALENDLDLGSTVGAIEKAIMEAALARHRSTLAATTALNCHRSTFNEKKKRYGLT